MKLLSLAVLFTLISGSSQAGALPPVISPTPIGFNVTYSGPDGDLQFNWLMPAAGANNSLGTIQIKPRLMASQVTEIDLAPLITPTTGTLVFQGGAWTGNQFTFRFLAGQQVLNVVMSASLKNKQLAISYSADLPIVAAIDIGPWPASAGGAYVPVPYYSFYPMYSKPLNLFLDAHFDWQHSQATTLDGTRAIYDPLTNGTRKLLIDSIVVGVSPNLMDVISDINNPPSPYRQELAGKVVIDIMGGDFLDIAENLQRLRSYGLNNCAVLLHTWQRSGFDVALPAQFPANAYQGGDSGLLQVSSAAASSGCQFALHENYADYYPDYDYFTSAAVAKTSDNNFLTAHMNDANAVQSYSTKPTWFVTNAATQSPEIHSRYKTTATFIDVNSALLPWYRADMDAAASDAGTFAGFVKGNTALWNFERQVHSGPVFGEGLCHWFWSGLLDGAEAQLGVGVVPQNTSTATPLLVDFDLFRIHPLQNNHGMGYYFRWAGVGEDMNRVDLLDAYRMQEVAFGHAPYLSSHLWTPYTNGELWKDVPKLWQELNLVGPVAKRYGTQTAVKAQYQFKGNWTDLNTAVKANDWSRVQVSYANGDTIVANAQAQPLSISGFTLPQYGWLARGTNLLAYTAMNNGVIVDYAETATAIFANSRNQSDMSASGTVAQIGSTSFNQLGARRAQINFQWKVLDFEPTGDYLNFIMFVDESHRTEDPVIEIEQSPRVVTSRWVPGQTVPDAFQFSLPDSVPDGIYSIRVGLYAPGTSRRYKLLNSDDGTRRYTIGYLTVSNNGKSLTFRSNPAPAPVADPRLNASGSVVDFGSVKTDGLVWLSQEANSWTVRAYPRYRDVTMQFNATRVPKPSNVVCDSNQAAVQVTTPSPGYWQLSAKGAKSCHW